MTLMETVNFEKFNDETGKGLYGTLVDMGKPGGERFKFRFWEKDHVIYLTISCKVDGKDANMMYIMLPRSNKN